MWEEIMGTDSGLEFNDWLEKEYQIIYYVDTQRFAYNDRDQDRVNGAENIINNLAVEWLDSKGYHMSTPHRCTPDLNFRFRIVDTHRRSPHNPEIYLKIIDLKKYYDTRKEAIIEGVKKAFSLIEGGE